MDLKQTFSDRLKGTKDQVLIMGTLVEQSLTRAVEALKNRDLTMAHRIMADDANINQKRFEIENECIGLIATPQLAASAR